MRALAALLLTSCGGVGAADILAPDELTVGHGVGDHSGTAFRNEPFAGYEGESESTYAALTWSLPSFEEDRLTREERHAIREHNLAMDEAAEPAEAWTNQVNSPPLWLPVAVFGILLVGFISFWITNRRRQVWR